MERNYDNVIKSIEHLRVLHKTFLDPKNYSSKEDYRNYVENSKKVSNILSMDEVHLFEQLYSENSRQMILADIIEYIFISRGIYFISSGSNKKEVKQYKKTLFIKTILYFVNLLMSYETITVDTKLRKKLLKNLGNQIPELKKEELYKKLLSFKGKVGLTESESDADKNLNKYFDKILPKTAGGLWHELLVFSFLLRKDIGYILPLLLNQKFFSGSDILVPPDFLIIMRDKNIYGIEVGIKKEIQSGSFSIITNIPTATIDTINSRCSDRCPICKKWIFFCEKVINEFGDMTKDIGDKTEIKCLEECNIYKKEDILKGKCPYSKYSRNKTKKIDHKYTDGLHYHYSCVLKNLSLKERKKLVKQEDTTAIKTHYPYYAGIEMLFGQ